MALTIERKQNYLYCAMILMTVVVTCWVYLQTQTKWILFRKAENSFYRHQFNEAINYYQEALNKGPIITTAYVHLADAYVAEGKFSDAIQWYRRYLDLYPADTNARLSYAHALNWSGRLEEAKKEYQRVLKKNERNKAL